MVWKPAKAVGLIVGFVIVLTIIGIEAFVIQSMSGQRLGMDLYFTALLSALGIPLLVLWVYWYYELLALRYTLDRNALVITCGTSRRIVPLNTIQRIVRGSDISSSGEIIISQGFRGVGWPGYLKGHIHLADLGLLLVHSTEPLPRQLVVVTESVCYGISPKNPERFLEDYARRRALGPVQQLAQGREYASLVILPVWRDWLFWSAVILAIVANVALFGLIMNKYGALPERIPLHFDAQGEVDRIASKAWLLVVPGIGALTLGINALLGLLLHKYERLAAYLLTGTALSVQAVLYLAAIGILNR